jgi:O-antigen/teichoic acid export membrane protein
MGIGGPMALVQVADIWIVYSVNIMIANRLGAAQVPLYAVPATAFIVVMSLCNNLTYPYLPAYSEAAGRGDWSWIRRAAIRNLSIVMPAMLLAAVSLVVVGPYIISLWTHRQVTPARPLLFWLGLFYMMATWATTNATLLVGLGLVKTKALIHCTVAVMYVIGSWLGLTHFGLIAVPISGCVAYSVDVILSLPLALRNIKLSVADSGTSVSAQAGQVQEIA